MSFADSIGVQVTVDYWATPNEGESLDDLVSFLKSRPYDILEVDTENRRVRIRDRKEA